MAGGRLIDFTIGKIFSCKIFVVCFGTQRISFIIMCISTSEGMLRTPFAGQNRLSDAKTTFSVTKGTKITKIKGKPLKIMQNMQLKRGNIM